MKLLTAKLNYGIPELSNHRMKLRKNIPTDYRVAVRDKIAEAKATIPAKGVTLVYAFNYHDVAE
jgi:hypothetical protein